MISELRIFNSTNGTYLNGRKISTSEKLKNGDLIRLGESNVFEFSAAKDDQKDESLPVFENDTKDNEHKGFFSKRHDELNSEILEVPDDSSCRKERFIQGIVQVTNMGGCSPCRYGIYHPVLHYSNDIY